MTPEVGGSRASWKSYPVADLLGGLNEFERKNAPERLWVVGDLQLLRIEPRVSIVGSRRATDEGLSRARFLARKLAEAGVPVVSGLAEGVDTAAHVSAIEAGGRTIAVLGTAIDRVFPRQNAALQAEIGRTHLLLSQFAPGQPSSKATFPMRNRTMALVSNATVIVEAEEGSGTLHQGWEALRLGRPLFVAQSLLARADLKWPGEMQKYGARELARVEDILEDLTLPAGASFAELPF